MSAGRPYPYRHWLHSDLSEYQVDLIQKAAATRGSGSAITQGGLGTEIGLLVVGGALVVGGIFMMTLAGNITFREPAALVGGLALVAYGIWRLVHRSESSLGTFTLSTQAYHLVSDGGRVDAWSFADCVSLQVVHHHTNGRYSGTNLRLVYPVKALEVGDRIADPQQSVDHCIAQSSVFRDMHYRVNVAREAARTGQWQALEGANFLPRQPE